MQSVFLPMPLKKSIPFVSVSNMRRKNVNIVGQKSLAPPRLSNGMPLMLIIVLTTDDMPEDLHM